MGVSLDVWAGINSQGKTTLFIYEGTLNARAYQDILRKALVPAATEWFGEQSGGWEFQQDKATCHTAKSTQEFLKQEGIAIVDGWPTKGDDINPMENLWAILDERLEDKKFNTKSGMKKAIRAIWDKVNKDLLSNLINSLPD